MTYIEIIQLAIAAYFACFALIMRTGGWTAHLMFKIIPFFSAVGLFLIAFKLI